MPSANEESFGGRSYSQERGSHKRDNEKEDKEGGRHGPSYTDRRKNENQDREGRRSSSDGHKRKDDKPYRDGSVGPSSRRRDLRDSPPRRDCLHEARACEDRLPWRNEDGEPRQDVDNVADDWSRKRLDVNNASGRYQQRSRDDVSNEYKQRSRGADDVSDVNTHRGRDAYDVLDDRRQKKRDATDHKSRRERDVDNSSGDHSRKRGDVDNVRRRRDDDDVQDDRKERRRDADDTRDNRSRYVVGSDRSNKSRGVNDVMGDGRRRWDSDDVQGDSSRSRHKVDGGLDSYSQRRRDVDGTFDDRSHHGGGVRDQQQRSPHRSSHHDKRDAEDGGRDRFSTRFRNTERNDDELPELFSVHRAKVQSVRPFGVFVRLEGFYKQGLVHLSQLSDHEVTDREDSDEMKVQAIAAVAGEGDQVWVKVISLKDDGGGVKIGCSLKLVSQSTGKDLDPNNLKLDQQQPKGNRQEPKKVTLDAIYNVVCSRCGGHGHLKTECYGMADKSYELLPEEDDDLTEQVPQPSQTQMHVGEVGVKPGFGRGRAMVLPAWMTHGSAASMHQNLGSSEPEKKKKRKASELPDNITTVEEAMALIAQVKKAKKEKHHRKEHKKHRKDKKSKKSSNRESSSRKERG